VRLSSFDDGVRRNRDANVAHTYWPNPYGAKQLRGGRERQSSCAQGAPVVADSRRLRAV